MKTAYKFRIYPTNQQEAELEYALEVCRQLWNNALADRRNAWKEEGISRTYNRQAALLIIEKEHGQYSGVYSQVLQDVLRRLSKAFENFFRRVRERARKKGYPRFKSQYKSLTLQARRLKAEPFQDFGRHKGLLAQGNRRRDQNLYHKEGWNRGLVCHNRDCVRGPFKGQASD